MYLQVPNLGIDPVRAYLFLDFGLWTGGQPRLGTLPITRHLHSRTILGNYLDRHSVESVTTIKC